MKAELLIFGCQILASSLVVYAAGRGHRAEVRAAEDEARKEGGRVVYLELLSEVWKKAKGRGGTDYNYQLCFVALDEALRRLRRGDEVEPEVAATIIDGLGLHLEESDGEIIVAEN